MDIQKANGLTKRTVTNGQLVIDKNVAKAKLYPIESIYKGNIAKRGSNTLMGICPFHEEKTPSFAIYRSTNSWYCFACGEGGDVINFYSKLHNCSFTEAVKELSK